MKALLKKEFLLLHPSYYLGYLSVFFLLIPTYPAAMTFFLPLTISINTYVGYISENNDMIFSSLTPINKKDYIKAKLFMTVFLEVSIMLLSLPVFFIKQMIFSQEMMESIPGIDSILSIYGFSFLCYGIYNFCLWTIYTKTAPKRILATMLSIFIALICFTFFGIVIAYLPNIGKILDYNGEFLYQLLAFLVGMLCYVFLNLFTYHISANTMEKKDL